MTVTVMVAVMVMVAVHPGAILLLVAGRASGARAGAEGGRR